MVCLPAEKKNGKLHPQAMLAVMFSGDLAELCINWQTIIDPNDTARVSLRIDSDAVCESTWAELNNHRATLFRGDVRGLLRRLLTACTIVAQVVPLDGRPITFTFDVIGFARELERHPEFRQWVGEGGELPGEGRK